MSCFTIAASTASMPDFVGYNILASPAASITDTPTLDQFILARLDTNQDYITGFRNSFSCPGWDGRGQRFHSTVFQGLMIFLSQNNSMLNCPGPVAVPNKFICLSSCEAATTALRAIFDNTNICTPNTSAQERADILSTYTSMCSTLTNDNCIEAVQRESSTCGFLVQEDANVFCSQNQNDKCCPVSRDGTSNTTPNSASNTGDMTSSDEDNSVAGFFRKHVIPISVSAVLLIIIIIFLIWYFWRKRKLEDRKFDHLKDTNSGLIFSDYPSKDRFLAEPQPTVSKYNNVSPNFRGLDFGEASVQPRTSLFDTSLSQPYSMVVIHNYDKSLQDELTLKKGDLVTVTSTFNDGWALGSIGDQNGAFPLSCCKVIDLDDKNSDTGLLINRSDDSEHVEQHFSGAEIVRDIVVGLADGLTVPFALTAGLATLGNSNFVVLAGMAEIVAGSIAMGLGGYLAGKSEIEHFDVERRREMLEIETVPEKEEEEIVELFQPYGLSRESVEPLLAQFRKDPDMWADFMMKYELNLEKPSKNRTWISAATIGTSYFIGGLVPLLPYIAIPDATNALYASAGATLVALFLFGYFKARFVGLPSPLKSAFEMAFVGAVASGAAFGVAKSFPIHE